MSKYKIIASDLDGTLLNNSGSISPENLNAIETLASKGVHFVPCTGRSVCEIMPELRENPNIRYIIYSNGSAVLDKQTGERIPLCLSNELACKALDILCSYDLHLTARHDGKTYADANEQGEEKHTYYRLCKPHIEVVNNYSEKVPDLRTFCRTLDNIEVFAVFFHNKSDTEECARCLSEVKGLQVVRGWEYNLEIFAADSGKGNALRCLAQMTDTDISETIAVGDSGNDTSMLKAAGLGLAAGNACDEAKLAADEVICTNDEHTAKYILEHYIM